MLQVKWINRRNKFQYRYKNPYIEFLFISIDPRYTCCTAFGI